MMPDYSNFYGGRESLSFPLTKTFKSVQEMANVFKLGEKYTEVNYDEYVFIDTGDISDSDNGKLFRRGYKQNSQGGAIYIGQIVGEKGTGFIVAKNYTPDKTPQISTRTGAEAYFNTIYPNGYQDTDGIHTGYLLTAGYPLDDKDYYFFNFGKTETGEYEGWTYMGTTRAPCMVAGDIDNVEIRNYIQKSSKGMVWLITEKENDLVRLVITKKPKTIYQVNEKFNPAGMEVVVYHEDGTSEIVSDYYISGYDSSYAHISDILIIYHSVSASLTVEIQDDIKEIKVTHMPDKTEYYVGEEFDKTGLEITAYTNSGNHYIVTEYLLTGFSSAVAGTSTIQVTYSGKQTSFSVTILDIITSIYVDKPPTKIDYNIGDSFDPAGIIVKGLYISGNIKIIDLQDLSFSGFDSSTEGIKTITVTHTKSQKTTTFEVRVNMAIEKIEVTQPPKKLFYSINDKFDPSGIQVMAYYFDGRSFEVTDRVSYSGFDSKSPGAKTVTVHFLTFTTSFSVTVIDEFSYIYVKTMPTKTTYQLGENFDSNGLQVNVVMKSGQEREVTQSCSLSGFDSSQVGVCKITVEYRTYTSLTTTFNVTIEATKQVSIIATAQTGGTIIPSGTQTYDIGTSAQYKGVKNTGYTQTGFTVDGTTISGSSYTFRNLQEDHSIRANFARVYTIYATSDSHGTVTPNVIDVIHGESCVFKGKPDEHYMILEWRVDGQFAGRDTTLQLTNVVASHKVELLTEHE